MFQSHREWAPVIYFMHVFRHYIHVLTRGKINIFIFILSREIAKCYETPFRANRMRNPRTACNADNITTRNNHPLKGHLKVNFFCTFFQFQILDEFFSGIAVL